MSEGICSEWSRRPDDELPSVIKGHVEGIIDKQSWVYDNMSRLLDMYLGTTNDGKERYIQTVPAIMATHGVYHAKLNFVASIVDTVGNRITSRQIKPLIVGSGGSWEKTLQARALEKYTTGVCYREKYADVSRAAFFDALIQNIGYILTGFDGEDIFLEHVPPQQVIVDEEQAFRGKVNEMFRVRDYTPYELADIYPDKEEDILGTATESVSLHNDNYRTGIIRVYEAWRLGTKKRPGIHTVTTSGYHLQDKEDYTKDYFPIHEIRAKARPGHWVGMGLVEELYTLQLEVDRETARVQKNHDLHGDPPIIVDIKARVPDEHITQVHSGRVIKYDSSQNGQPPRHIIQPSIHPEFHSWINQCTQWGHEFSGVSQMSAQGTRPAGNDLSGFAFRVLDDIQSKRLANAEIAWQNAGPEVAKRIVDISAEAFKGKSKKVKYVSKSFVETIDWKECGDLDKDAYYIRFYPGSIYPDTPGGRIETAERLMNAGLANKVEARAEIYGPESERMQSYHTAPIDDINLQIDEMLMRGEYSSPLKYQDLELGIATVNSAFLWARADGAPEDRKALMLKWLDEADAIVKHAKRAEMQAQMESQAEMQGAMGGGPSGNPENTPPQNGPILPTGGE